MHARHGLVWGKTERKPIQCPFWTCCPPELRHDGEMDPMVGWVLWRKVQSAFCGSLFGDSDVAAFGGMPISTEVGQSERRWALPCGLVASGTTPLKPTCPEHKELPGHPSPPSSLPSVPRVAARSQRVLLSSVHQCGARHRASHLHWLTHSWMSSWSAQSHLRLRLCEPY